MTREEIDFIGSMNMCDEISNEAYKKIVCHFREQEPCEDAISRQEAIEAMYALCNTDETLKENPWRDNPHIDAITDAIEDLPSVNPLSKDYNTIYYTPQPKTGYWILTSDDDCEYCTCSECGYQNGENWMIGSQIKFCQECGAKMIEPQESEGVRND